MAYDTKIATCSYCARRQALRMTARDGHELACGSCGAPLHEMKWLRRPSPTAKRSPPRPAPHGHGLPPRDLGARRKKKKRKTMWKKAFEEVFEVLEDIFD